MIILLRIQIALCSLEFLFNLFVNKVDITSILSNKLESSQSTKILRSVILIYDDFVRSKRSFSKVIKVIMATLKNI